MRRQTVSVEQLERMRNYAVYSRDGEKIGCVEEVYVDEQSQRPEWIGLGTGFFGTKHVLVPFEGVSVTEDRVTVPYAKDHVKDAPDIDSHVIDPETERALYAYYARGGRADTTATTSTTAITTAATTTSNSPTMTTTRALTPARPPRRREPNYY